MNQGYGNIGWELFVYSSYIFVALSLLIYVLVSTISCKKSLRNMKEEGFFQATELDHHTSEDSNK